MFQLQSHKYGCIDALTPTIQPLGLNIYFEESKLGFKKNSLHIKNFISKI